MRNTLTLGNAHVRLSTCLSVCNTLIDTTTVSNHCETRWAGRDRKSETNGQGRLSQSLFAQSINRVCGYDVRSPATVRHPLIPRVQDTPAHQAAFVCVRTSVCHGRCVFFAEVAYNDRLQPPRLPSPIGRVVLIYIYIFVQKQLMKSQNQRASCEQQMSILKIPFTPGITQQVRRLCN